MRTVDLIPWVSPTCVKLFCSRNFVFVVLILLCREVRLNGHLTLGKSLSGLFKRYFEVGLLLMP
jgi:hypothetical protein